MNKFWLGNLDLSKKVTIYGGGISGLSAAYFFKKNNIDFELHEISDRLGGKIHSIKSPYGIIETGANALVASPEIKKLLQELELPVLPIASKLKRLVLRKGIIRSFPALSPIEILSIFFKSFKKVPNKKTVYETFLPLLGQEKCNELLTPMLRGIYASASEDLSRNVIEGIDQFIGKSFYSFLKYKTSNLKNFGGSISFPLGMQELVDSLQNKIEGHYYLNSEIKLRENSLICTDPYSAAMICENNKISEKLKSLPMAPIFSTTFFMRYPIESLNKSFGILFNTKDSYNIMGVLVNHEIFQMRQESEKKDLPYSYTIISKEKVSNEDIEFLGKNLNTSHFTNDLDFKKYELSYEFGLPLYSPERSEKIEEINQLIESNLAFWGNYTSGISLRVLTKPTT